MTIQLTEAKLRLFWYCGFYNGAPKWHRGIHDAIYEPDECMTEFETLEYVEDWHDEICTAICPRCGAELTQEYDSPELADESYDG